MNKVFQKKNIPALIVLGLVVFYLFLSIFVHFTPSVETEHMTFLAKYMSVWTLGILAIVIIVLLVFFKTFKFEYIIYSCLILLGTAFLIDKESIQSWRFTDESGYFQVDIIGSIILIASGVALITLSIFKVISPKRGSFLALLSFLICFAFVSTSGNVLSIAFTTFAIILVPLNFIIKNNKILIPLNLVVIVLKIISNPSIHIAIPLLFFGFLVILSYVFADKNAVAKYVTLGLVSLGVIGLCLTLDPVFSNLASIMVPFALAALICCNQTKGRRLAANILFVICASVYSVAFLYGFIFPAGTMSINLMLAYMLPCVLAFSYMFVYKDDDVQPNENAVENIAEKGKWIPFEFNLKTLLLFVIGIISFSLFILFIKYFDYIYPNVQTDNNVAGLITCIAFVVVILLVVNSFVIRQFFPKFVEKFFILSSYIVLALVFALSLIAQNIGGYISIALAIVGPIILFIKPNSKLQTHTKILTFNFLIFALVNSITNFVMTLLNYSNDSLYSGVDHRILSAVSLIAVVGFIILILVSIFTHNKALLLCGGSFFALSYVVGGINSYYGLGSNSLYFMTSIGILFSILISIDNPPFIKIEHKERVRRVREKPERIRKIKAEHVFLPNYGLCTKYVGVGDDRNSFRYVGTVKHLVWLFFKSAFLSIITLGIYSPWAITEFLEDFLSDVKHPQGLSIQVDINPAELFIKFLIWGLISAVTLGVFAFVLPDRVLKWFLKRTYVVSPNNNYYSISSSGNWLGLLIKTIWYPILICISFGFAIPYCMMNFINFVLDNYVYVEELNIESRIGEEYIDDRERFVEKYLKVFIFTICTFGLYLYQGTKVLFNESSRLIEVTEKE